MDETSLEARRQCITQLEKMSVDPKFIEFTADVLRIIFYNSSRLGSYSLYPAVICGHPRCFTRLQRVSGSTCIFIDGDSTQAAGPSK